MRLLLPDNDKGLNKQDLCRPTTSPHTRLLLVFPAVGQTLDFYAVSDLRQFRVCCADNEHDGVKRMECASIWLAAQFGSTMSFPRSIRMPQVHVNSPDLSGVNSIVVVL